MSTTKAKPVSIEEFEKMCTDVPTHLSMEEGSFQELIQYEQARHKLYTIARAGGMRHMELFAYHFYGGVERAIRDARSDGEGDGWQKAREYYEKRIETGDVEFDAFRKSVVNFDFTYMFSDSITVWRAGNEAEKQIRENLEKGGIYKTFYDHWTSKELG